MVLERINVYKVSIPFLREFAHSRSKKASANNIVVEIIAKQGEVLGYGEGAPRLGVTGETQESAIDSIGHSIKRDSFPWKLNDVLQIWDFVDDLPEGKENNSAICALEMALLDVLGKIEGRSIIQYFPQDFFANRVFYGAAVTLESKEKVLEMCNSIKAFGINHIRIKLGKNFEQNKDSLKTVRMVLGDDCILRADLNNAWDIDSALDHLQIFKKYNINYIEQPLAPDEPNIADFAKLAQTDGIILVADELACSLGDVKIISKEGFYEMVNIRLSKCGGFRRSLRIIDYLRKHGIHFQIGCHMGESGILSAAGRAMCLLCQDALFYDGSYDSFLLKKNITLEHVSFNQGGEASPLGGSGLGVEINKQNLTHLSNDVVVFEPFS